MHAEVGGLWQRFRSKRLPLLRYRIHPLPSMAFRCRRHSRPAADTRAGNKIDPAAAAAVAAAVSGCLLDCVQ